MTTAPGPGGDCSSGGRPSDLAGGSPDGGAAHRRSDGTHGARLRGAPPSCSPPDVLLAPDDPHYPKGLLILDKPPKRLYARGDLSALEGPMVAIVGSRHPTNYGIKVAYEAAREAARAGLIVVSGLARGLDARAHRGALDGGGKTIAVLGCGLDVPYPRSNADLLAAIPENGLLLTEFEPGRPPEQWTFPSRNRIIAALASCVLVVEGQRAGGTDNTAWWMLHLNKRVLAVPGRIDEVVAEGPNRLIQDGAWPYLTPQDLLDQYGLTWADESGSPAGARRAPCVPSVRRRAAGAAGESAGEDRRRAAGSLSEPASRSGAAPEPIPLDDDVLEALSGLAAAEAAVFDVVTPDPVHVDRLVERAGLPPATLLAALSSLEIKGLVTQLPGKQFRLAS